MLSARSATLPAMTDFGANIFDDKQPPQGGGQPPKAPRTSRAKKAKAPLAADEAGADRKSVV